MLLRHPLHHVYTSLCGGYEDWCRRNRCEPCFYEGISRVKEGWLYLLSKANISIVPGYISQRSGNKFMGGVIWQKYIRKV